MFYSWSLEKQKPLFSSVEKLWTQNTRIIHDVWRLLILSNGEKRMITKILKKEWFIWKFWKKGGSREKGEEEAKSMPPCACALGLISWPRADKGYDMNIINDK